MGPLARVDVGHGPRLGRGVLGHGAVRLRLADWVSGDHRVANLEDRVRVGGKLGV